MCPFDGISLVPVANAAQPADSPGVDVSATIPDGFVRPEYLGQAPHDPEATVQGAPPASLIAMLAAGDVHTGGDDADAPDRGDYVSLRNIASTTAAMHAMSIDESASPYQYMVGMTLDQRYTVEHILGEGGMGVVFLAQHNMLEKPVAIKVLKPEVAHNAEATQRFLREARSASSIGHPNIVEFTDFGTTPDGLTYSVMEYVDGPTLDQVLAAEGPLAAPRAIDVARKLAEALGAAHSRSVVHRDLKPENIFLYDHEGTRDRVKIVDFGIAKIIEMGRATQVPSITADGTIFGTPEYMAPEQASGRSNIDHRADVYSLGIILYEMLTRVVPHKTNNGMRTLAMRMLDPVKPMSEVRPDLSFSAELEDLLASALTTDPARRLPSMGHFLARLDELSVRPGVDASASASPSPSVDEPLDHLATTPYLGHVDELMAAYPQMRPEMRPSQPAISVPDSPGLPAPEPAPRNRSALSLLALLVAALAGGIVGFLIFGSAGDQPGNQSGSPALAADASPGPDRPAALDSAPSAARSAQPQPATTGAGDPDRSQTDRAARDEPTGNGRRSGARDKPDGQRSGNPTGNPSGDTSVQSSGQPGPTPAETGPTPTSPGRSVSVTILAQPEHASLYVEHNYSGQGGTTFQRPEGTEITVECRHKGYQAGRVTVRFDGQKEAYLCQAKRVPQCVDGLKNPFDDCPD